MPDAPTDSRSGVSLLPILMVNFIGTLGFSIVLPFLVFLVTRWGGNAFIYGIIGAAYSVFQLFGAPVLGRWSDRFGRKRILLLSQLGTLASWILFAVAFMVPETSLFSMDSGITGSFVLTLPLAMLFLARALDGVTGGNISVANAYLADISTEETRSRNFGRMAVAANFGFILGPAIAGLLGSTTLGELLPVLAAIVISLAASLLIAFGLKERLPAGGGSGEKDTGISRALGQELRDCHDAKENKDLRLGQVVKLPGIGYLLTINFLVMLGFNFFYVAFPAWAVAGLQWDVGMTGIFFTVMAAAMALVQGPLLNLLSGRITEASLIIIGSGLLALSFVAFVSSNLVLVYAGVLLLATGNGLLWPSFMALLARQAGSRHQGAVQGVSGSIGAVASIAGLLLGGVLFAMVGSLVFLISAATIGVVFVLSLRCPTMRGASDLPQPAEAAS